MPNSHPKSVGLAGDGDEIEAIYAVEQSFGVGLDKADVPSWFTAGDVFKSLRNALPLGQRDQPGLRDRFALVLCGQTGVDPDQVEPDSPLLGR